jgi:hypothetical protein
VAKEAKRKADYGTLWNRESGSFQNGINKLRWGGGTHKRNAREGAATLRHLETKAIHATLCWQREIRDWEGDLETMKVECARGEE